MNKLNSNAIPRVLNGERIHFQSKKISLKIHIFFLKIVMKNWINFKMSLARFSSRRIWHKKVMYLCVRASCSFEKLSALSLIGFEFAFVCFLRLWKVAPEFQADFRKKN